MVASCKVLAIVTHVPKAGIPSPRDSVVRGKWSRALGFIEEEGKAEDLAIVVLLVGALCRTCTGGGGAWIGGGWSDGGWSGRGSW